MFEWANAMLVVLVEQLLGEDCELPAQEELLRSQVGVGSTRSAAVVGPCVRVGRDALGVWGGGGAALCLAGCCRPGWPRAPPIEGLRIICVAHHRLSPSLRPPTPPPTPPHPAPPRPTPPPSERPQVRHERSWLRLGGGVEPVLMYPRLELGIQHM